MLTSYYTAHALGSEYALTVQLSSPLRAAVNSTVLTRQCKTAAAARDQTGDKQAAHRALVIAQYYCEQAYKLCSGRIMQLSAHAAVAPSYVA
jgi:hypothetical protein